MGDYYCTNCGADLERQLGFDPDSDYWTCAICGQELYGEGTEADTSLNYPGVIWRCDDCGAILNKQDGFDDGLSIWICEECGHVNDINESEILNNHSGPLHSGPLDSIVGLLDSIGNLAETVASVQSSFHDKNDHAIGDEHRECKSNVSVPSKEAGASPQTAKAESRQHASRKGSFIKKLLLAVILFTYLLGIIAFPNEGTVACEELIQAIGAWFGLTIRVIQGIIGLIVGLFSS